MRRHSVPRPVTPAAVAVAALLATACGGADADTPTEDAGAGEPAATRTIEHALGTTEVPVDASRIVVADRRGTLPTLLDLGVEPVAAVDASAIFGQPFHPAIAADVEAAGVEVLPAADFVVEVEPVAAARPDLIIGASVDIETVYDQLSGIAPTVALDFDFEDPRENVVPIGAVVGLEGEAAQLLADFEAEVADVGAELDDVGTVSIVGLFAPDDLRIYRDGNLVGQLVEQLGGTVVPTEDELPYDPVDPLINTVSAEQLPLLSGDRLVAFVNEGDEARRTFETLTADVPTYATLPAVQAGEVLELDPQLVFFTAGVSGLREALDQLAGFLAEP